MLQRRGVNSVAIVIDGTTFGGNGNYDSLFVEKMYLFLIIMRVNELGRLQLQ